MCVFVCWNRPIDGQSEGAIMLMRNIYTDVRATNVSTACQRGVNFRRMAKIIALIVYDLSFSWSVFRVRVCVICVNTDSSGGY